MKIKATLNSLLCFFILFSSWVGAQLHPSAALQINSTTQGFLLPKMTQSQMDKISNPAEGLMIYCSDCPGGKGVRVFNSQSSSWVENLINLYNGDGQLSENRTVSLTTNKLSFVSNSGSSALAIDGQNNRVGIGTNNPTEMLEVNGTSKFNGMINTNSKWISGDGDNQGFYVKTDGGVVMQNADTNTNQLTVLGSSFFDGNINTHNNWISGDGGNEGIMIADNGNVGIGTTNPGSKLKIYENNASTNPNLEIEQNGSGDATLSFLITNFRRYNVGVDNSDSDKFKLYSDNGGHFTGTGITMDVSGNVGIGMSNPTNRLHVVGRIMQQGGGDLGLNLRNTNAPANQQLRRIQVWNNGILHFQRFSDDGRRWIDNDMVIDNTGRVGIGTNAPGYPLDVGSSGSAIFTPTNPHATHQPNNIRTHFADWDYPGVVARFGGNAVAGALLTTSDSRIKNIKGVSNSKEDLAVLDKIKITDYTKKDVRMYGNKPE